MPVERYPLSTSNPALRSPYAVELVYSIKESLQVRSDDAGNVCGSTIELLGDCLRLRLLSVPC